MSRFFSPKYKNLKAYVPGEQPKDMKYIKLNTNESPFPPPQSVRDAIKDAADLLELYPDPTLSLLRAAASRIYDVAEDEVIFSNGSDEVLDYAFAAFCDENTPAVFPDISYGFYPVFANVNCVPSRVIPLKDDFTIDITEYFDAKGTIFIANPNAPTGIALPVADIEKILDANRDNVVVIDEAYVDFGAESAVPLIKKYDNLLVVQTVSKSRSMAGARLGFAFGCRELIRDLDTVRNSRNPYNVNRLTMAAGIASFEAETERMLSCLKIVSNREYTEKALSELGFEMTDSSANFIFVRHPKVSGEKLYLELRKCGILVRHFSVPRISDYNRITIGDMDQMKCLVDACREIIAEETK